MGSKISRTIVTLENLDQIPELSKINIPKTMKLYKYQNIITRPSLYGSPISVNPSKLIKFLEQNLQNIDFIN